MYSGGGSQKAGASFDGEPEVRNSENINVDGQTQLRGESHENQDKFRITVDLEQALFGWFGSADTTPQMSWGLTSVIFTGAHFNAQNVDRNNLYVNDEIYTYNGTTTVHKAGEPVQHGLGRALLDFREKHQEMWKEMHDLGMRFYQQPAGFEDTIITKWKIKEQGEHYPCSISLKDMFTGGLSEPARLEAANRQQLCSWIRPKVTALIQLADTTVIRIFKLIKLQLDHQLRTELAKLAQLEQTRSVFHCGMYDIEEHSGTRSSKQLRR